MHGGLLTVAGSRQTREAYGATPANRGFAIARAEISSRVLPRRHTPRPRTRTKKAPGALRAAGRARWREPFGSAELHGNEDLLALALHEQRDALRLAGEHA